LFFCGFTLPFTALTRIQRGHSKFETAYPARTAASVAEMKTTLERDACSSHFLKLKFDQRMLKMRRTSASGDERILVRLRAAKRGRLK